MRKYNKKAGIYQILNLENGKCYIGYSEWLAARWINHRVNLRKNKHINSHLQRAWNLYGEEKFKFIIIENLPSELSQKEYENIETKWIMHYKSHLEEFGYNACLPGNIPLKYQGENKRTKTKYIRKIPCICINMVTKEILEKDSYIEICNLVGIKSSKIVKLTGYWRNNKGSKKSYKGWIIIKKEDYNPNFDYINYKKERYKNPIKKTWRDYYKKEKYRKNPENIIPYSERRLKRIPILAINIETGEEIKYNSITEATKYFTLDKIRKCLNNEFMRYKHKGHYFKKIIE